jgi:pyrroline-5-carboxylate reductase
VLRDQTLAVLGAGYIGQAIVGGLLRGSDLAPEHIRATRRTAAALDELRERWPGVTVTADNVEAVRDAPS